jgi:hypothetical protein
MRGEGRDPQSRPANDDLTTSPGVPTSSSHHVADLRPAGHEPGATERGPLATRLRLRRQRQRVEAGGSPPGGSPPGGALVKQIRNCVPNGRASDGR